MVKKKVSKNNSGIKILSYDLLNALNKKQRIDKIFSLVKTNQIVLIEGRIDPEEELELTNLALKKIDDKFSGIEIAHLSKTENEKKKTLINMVKDKLVRFLVKGRLGITVIGPSKKIKEIKLDPTKLEIFFK